MQIQFRPYSLVTEMDGTIAASSIVLKDTAGAALDCNFVSVEASGENADAYFRVATDPASLITPMSNYSDTSGALGTTSGIVGGYASVNKGVVELLLSDKDRTSTVEIGLDQVGDCKFFITYGQIQGGNIRRDNERPIGS